MKILLSPAKSLDFESPLQTKKASTPSDLERSQELVELMSVKSPSEIGKMMGISPKLSQLNWERFQDWGPDALVANGRAALLAFRGDVYQGLDVARFSERDFTHAQKHIRILSGLHGMLRPLDLILPYRLEMGSKLPNSHGRDLYSFWRDEVTDRLNQELSTTKPKLVVNLASNEYFGAVKSESVEAPIVSPVFKDLKNGEYKIISFYAKKARGAMAAWLVLNRVKTKSGLIDFDGLGYSYSPEGSTLANPLFLRDVAA